MRYTRLMITTALLILLAQVQVTPEGYSGPDSGFVAIDNFPLARAIKEYGDDRYECVGRVGRVTIGGNPNYGHATPALSSLHVTSSPGERATIEGLEFWSNEGALGDLHFERLEIEAQTSSNSAVGAQLVDFEGRLLTFERCQFTNSPDRNLPAKWGIRIGGWDRLILLFNGFDYFKEHSGYFDSIGSIHAEGNDHTGNGRTCYQYAARPKHGGPSAPSDTLIFKDEIFRSGVGDGGGMLTVAGFTGRGIYAIGCEFHIGKDAGNRRAITIWTPLNEGPSEMGQWIYAGREWHAIYTTAQMNALREEHGDLYGQLFAQVESCSFFMDGGEQGAIEFSGVLQGMLKGRFTIVGSDFGKPVLSLNPYEGWPNGDVKLGWKKPSKWSGIMHAGSWVKNMGRTLTNEEVDAMGVEF